MQQLNLLCVYNFLFCNVEIFHALLHRTWVAYIDKLKFKVDVKKHFEIDAIRKNYFPKSVEYLFIFQELYLHNNAV